MSMAISYYLTTALDFSFTNPYKIKPMILTLLILIFTIKSLRFFAKQDNNINEIFKNNLTK
jgi:hypothetical protein